MEVFKDKKKLNERKMVKKLNLSYPPSKTKQIHILMESGCVVETISLSRVRAYEWGEYMKEVIL